MTNYIVFDNEGRTPDRYTIVDRVSGNVFAAGNKDGDLSGRYCGNCADHRIVLYGAGWREMPLNKRVIEAETANYVRNAQLDPSWLGKELPQRHWPIDLLDYIGRLKKPQQPQQPQQPLHPQHPQHPQHAQPSQQVSRIAVAL